jgi:uncharacterized protein (TIGR02996 family)
VTDEAAFEAAIAAAPDDDTPRLVFADWLGDRGRDDDAFYHRARVAVKPVLADPDDDAPRLAFAAWCDGQGRHARADLIRDQITLSRKPACPAWCDHDPDKCAVTRLEKAVAAHLEACRADVWGGVPQFELTPLLYTPAGAPWGDWWRACVHRGFIERVFTTGPAWVEHADHLLAFNPVRNVFTDGLPEMWFDRRRGP